MLTTEQEKPKKQGGINHWNKMKNKQRSIKPAHHQNEQREKKQKKTHEPKL